MKKSLCLLVVSLLSVLTSWAEVVTPSRALQIAEEFLGEELVPQRVRGLRGVAAAAEQENAPLYVISRGDDIYDLPGRKVQSAAMQPGRIYIRNGKKTIIVNK